MSEGRRSVRYGEEAEGGEGRRGYGWAGEEVFLWLGGQSREKGYHDSCREAERLGHPV